MTGRRILEMGLAALVAGGALFAAFVPGALSETARLDQDTAQALNAVPTPRVNPAQLRDPDFYQDLRISETSRRVAQAVLAAPAPSLNPVRAQRSEIPQIAMDGFAVTPRARAESGDGWSASALGVQVRVAPDAGASDPQWWIVGGAGRETYALSPGSLREFTVAPFSSETVIGDTHLGVAVKLSDRAHASFGYVREKREFNLGREDWEEDEHFLGVGLHARW